MIALHEALETWMDGVGLDAVDDRLTEILLVYDYSLETTTIDDSGSHTITGALKGQPVTLDTAYQPLAMVYNRVGIPTHIKPVFQQDLPSKDTNAQPILNVLHKGYKYAVVFEENLTYDSVIIGQTNIKTLLEETFVRDDLDMQGELGVEYALFDIPRERIQKAVFDS